MPNKDLEKARENKLEWKRNNPEKVKLSSRNWYTKVKDKKLSEASRLRKEFPEKFRKKDAAWRDENRDKILERNLKLVGWTAEEYNLAETVQSGLCAICGRKETGKNKKRLSADHDHKTNLRRDLLCSKCNVGLGVFEDNITFLLSAVTYLWKHGKYE